MTASEFLSLSIGDWPLFGALALISLGVTFASIHRIALGGIFDPAVLIFVANYSINYAVILFLYFAGEMSALYLILAVVYGVVLVIALRTSSRPAIKSSLFLYVTALTPARMGRAAFGMAAICYGLLSAYVISRMGLGILVEENRFEAARGIGVFIRIMDALTPFIVAFWTVLIVQKTRRRLPSIIGLILFVMFASMVNGAKIAMVYQFVTAFLALRMAKFQISLPPIRTALALAASIGFVFFTLQMNLVRNEVVQQADSPLAGTSLVLERFIFRVIANGNTSYMLLPNDVIEKISTDSILVRFAAPFLGTSNLSKVLGYNVNDFSVGRQALLYFDPAHQIAGGPTSHFDLFAYVYFGFSGGVIFVAMMGYLLGAINRCVWLSRRESETHINPFRIALVATMWSRAVQMILEPTVGFAYFVDILVIFSAISLTLHAAGRGTKSRLPPSKK